MKPLIKKAVIADDEGLVRERIEQLLEKYPEFQVVESVGNGKDAIRAVTLHRPDILFLDIKMPQGGGFQVINQLEDTLPKVIFITAHNEYAVKAFEIEAFDYILKPITKKRFHQTISRLKQSFNDTKENRVLLVERKS